MKRVALGLWLVACGCSERVPVITAGDVPLDAGADATQRDDAFRIEPTTTSECDQQDDCDACTRCSIAPFEPCNTRALACEEDASCTALAGCVQACADDDAACARACVERFGAGRDLLVELYRCMACDACPADCRPLHQLWCEEPPI